MSEVLSCYWKISINGTLIDTVRQQCIESIDLEERCDGSDTCTINISDPEYLFISDNIFIEEAKIKVVMGWTQGTQTVTFNGYISAIDIDFPSDGYPVMNLFCLDNSHRMNRKKKKRSWDNVTNATVIQKIAKEYGYKSYIQPGYAFKKEDTISQSDTTDIEFCESLADNEKDPFMCKLIGTTLFYVKKGILRSPVATVYYKKYPYDVISFTPKINKETSKNAYSDADIDTTSNTTYEYTATDANTARDVQGSAVK